MDPRKLGGSVAEGPRKQDGFGGSGAEPRGSVAEGSPKQVVQTLPGLPTLLFETDMFLHIYEFRIAVGAHLLVGELRFPGQLVIKTNKANRNLIHI